MTMREEEGSTIHARVAETLDGLARRMLPAGSDFSWSVEGDAVRLDLVWIPRSQRGSGVASRFMKSLVAACDRIGLPLILAADGAEESTALSTDLLLEWYARLGFEVVGVTREGWPMMQRVPLPHGPATEPGHDPMFLRAP